MKQIKLSISTAIIELDLTDGTKTLKDGVDTFNEEGISKVSDFVDEDLAGFEDRVKGMIDMAKDYEIFSDAKEGSSTSVKFIYETEKIG